MPAMFHSALRTMAPAIPALRAFSTTVTLLKTLTSAQIAAKAKSLGLAPPPKTPMGPYSEFFRELYPTIRGDHLREDGKIDSHEVARVAGARWNALSAEDRKKYNEAAKRATEKYKSDYKRYYESLPAGAAEDLGLTAPGTKSLSASARNAAARKARGEPAKPQGSFFVFLHDFRKSDELRQMMERDGVENGAAVYTAKKAGEKWAVMSEEEKQQWVNKSNEQKQTYAEWKGKQA